MKKRVQIMMLVLTILGSTNLFADNGWDPNKPHCSNIFTDVVSYFEKAWNYLVM